MVCVPFGLWCLWYVAAFLEEATYSIPNFKLRVKGGTLAFYPWRFLFSGEAGSGRLFWTESGNRRFGTLAIYPRKFSKCACASMCASCGA